MKKILTICMALLLGCSSVAGAVIINVAGQQIDIPSNYRTTFVEKRANRCVARMLKTVESEAGVQMLPLVCTQMVLNGDDSWEK
jgi:hypothetical protein